MEEKVSNFGERLKKLRQQKHLSQADIAMKIGIAKETIYRYENNIQEPTLQRIIQIAQLFHTSIDYLVGYDNQIKIDISNLNEKQRDVIEKLLEIFLIDT